MGHIISELLSISNAINSIALNIESATSPIWLELLKMVLPLAVSVIAVVIAITAKKSENKILKENRFDSLMQKYFSKEMSDNVKGIYNATTL